MGRGWRAGVRVADACSDADGTLRGNKDGRALAFGSPEPGAMNTVPARPPRLLALAEAEIPSAVLGVHAVAGFLAAMGHCEFRIGTSVAARAADLAWCDALILVRGAAPAEVRLLREAQRLGRRVATYLDDDLENVPAGARSAYFFRSAVVRRGVAEIVRAADAVLVCNPLLGDELAHRHGISPTVLLQPAPSPRLDFLRAPGATRGTAAPRGTPPRRVRIGFLGSVDHAAFIDELLGDVLRQLARERAGTIDFVFCGAKPELVTALGATWHPFDPDFAHWRATAAALDLDIGLAPLPESPFHRFKYWNKFLEYGSLGIAGIYSEGSPNAQIVRDGESGLVRPNKPEAWHEALCTLLDDPSLRQRLGATARAEVEGRFAPAALESAWLAALAALLAHRAAPVEAAQVRLATGRVRHLRDRLAVYGPLRFAERLVGRLSGRLRPS